MGSKHGSIHSYEKPYLMYHSFITTLLIIKGATTDVPLYYFSIKSSEFNI